MKIEKQLITPTMAKELLEKNIKNRRVKSEKVLEYSNEIKNNRWKSDSGELIKISKTGVLLDGQHRLLAVVNSAISTYFHVATEMDDDVFSILDTGTRRNASDVFKIESIKNDNLIPAVISTYNTLKVGTKTKLHTSKRATNTMLLEQYYEREEFWQTAAQKAYNGYNSFAKILTPSTIGGFYAFFYDINKEDSNIFIEQLTTGQDIKNKTIALLRTKLMQDKMSAKKMPPSLKNIFILKTWNCFRKNEEVKVLRFNSETDTYPVAV